MGGIVVNTNLSSLMVQRNLTNATDDMNTYMKRLSTGLRINDSGDDAAGLALSEKLKSHINSSAVAKNNAQTGVNMLQIAEGDLGSIQDSLQRMRDLAVQAANGVYSSSERDALDKEYQQRLAEVDRVAVSSAFSDLKLLDGSISTMQLQIGTGAGTTTNTLDITSAFGLADASTLGVGGTTVTTVAVSRTAISAIDTAINNISDRRSTIGATTNRLDATMSRIDIRKENLQASYSIIRDADIATEAANLTRSQILQQASTTLLQQANQGPSIALSLL